MTKRPRLYLSATRKSSGKTTISAGLCGALRSRGLTVQSFKKGPDYIDPMWLGRLSGRPCYNLDFNTQSDAEIRALCADRSADKDITLIEGNKGLFDGVDIDGADCNAAMARLLDAAVVLVVDCEGMTRGIAPLLNGYQNFADGFGIDAVILNRVSGNRHERKLREMIARYTDIEVVGAVQRDPALEIAERHLGLTTDGESPAATRIEQQLGHAIVQQVDIERLLELGKRTEIPLTNSETRADRLPLHIGVAMDSAFCFYYRDDLETLRKRVHQVSFFSPLADQRLPDCDALLFGGGFPETHAGALQGNVGMRHAIARFAGAGGPIYAECGGLMYLGQTMRWNETRFEMVGALPVDTIMRERPVGRGYVRIRTTEQHPWLPAGREIPAHEFHYSDVTAAEGLSCGYDVKRGHGIDGARDGLVFGNVFASYSHLRNTASNPWISCFLGSVQRHQALAA